MNMYEIQGINPHKTTIERLSANTPKLAEKAFRKLHKRKRFEEIQIKRIEEGG